MLFSFYIQGANILELKKYLILSCILIGMTCEAQVKNFSFHGSANYPIIKTVETDLQPVALTIPAATGYSSYVTQVNVRESFSSKVGFEIGSRFDYSVTSKFFITSGLSVSHIRFKRTEEISLLSPDIQFHNLPTTVGQPFGSVYGTITWRDAQGNVILNPPSLPQKSENIGNTTTWSVLTPVIIGTSFLNKKLEVRTGALFSYLLRATQTKEQYTASTYSMSEYKDSSKDGFSEFQVGITVQTSYLFGRHIGIDFAAQKFFTPIYTSTEQFGDEPKYNLLTLGLSYHL
jgi:hypothetical protein